MEENQVETTQSNEVLEQAVSEVAGGNQVVANLAKKALKGDVQDLSPEEAQQVQAVLEAVKALVSTQPEAAQMLESVQSSLRPVIQAGLSSTNQTDVSADATQGLGTGTNQTTSTETSGDSEDSGNSEAPANQVFSAPEPAASAQESGFSVVSSSSAEIAGRSVSSSLGAQVEVANAGFLAPFVEQQVKPDGQLGGSVQVSGQVGDLADLSGKLAAGSVGGGDVSQLLDTITAQDEPQAPEAPVEPPPPPIGRVSIKTEESSKSILESAQGETRTLTFILTRTDATSLASVNWKAEGISLDTLAPGEKLEGIARFLPGQSTTKVELVVKGDNIQEATQKVTVKLGATQGLLELSGGALEAEATIRNDDSVFSVTKVSAPALEGAQGENPPLTYRIDRTDATVATTIDWTLSGLNPQDFPGGTLPKGTVTFAAGQSSATVTIPTLGDNIQEDGRTAVFKLTGSGPNSVIHATQHTIEQNIGNDDSIFSVAALATTQREGAQGESPDLTYTITRTDATVATTINWSLEGLDPADFAGGVLPTGTITFEKGQLEATLTLKTKGDNLEEAGRTATLRLTGAGPNATINPDAQTASTQITNDDGTFSITAAKASQLEGAQGENPDLVYTIKRTDATMPTFIKWALEGLQASDFEGGVLPSGTIEFAQGQTEATITLKPKGDNIQEGSPVATVRLTEVGQHATIDPNAQSASTTIQNDDGIFSVVAAKASQLEGAVGESPILTYTIKRTDATVASSVKWALEGLDPADFAGGVLPGGEVQFAQGQTESIIQLTLKGDNTVEATRTATIRLSDSGPNATISTTEGTAQTIIQDDDSVISIQAVRTEQPEGQPGQNRVLEYTVTRTDTTVATTVEWKLEGLKPADFGGTLPSGQIQFAQGQNTATITIPTKVDYDIEADETATLKLTAHGSNTTINAEKAQAQTLVRTDDIGFTIQAVQGTTQEGAEGQFQKVTFKITRDGNLGVASSVQYEVASLGSSISGDSFKGGNLPTGTVNFAANETEKTIELEIAGNDRVIGSRDFQVLLKNPSEGNRILIGSAKGQILDDDAQVSVTAITPEIPEGNDGTSTATFKITRSGNLDAAQTLNWILSPKGELPIQSSDFSLQSGTNGQISFAAHQSEITIQIPIKSNNSSEADKLFTLDLQDTAGNNLELGQAKAQVKIIGDDASLSIKASSTGLLEGSAAGSEATHEFIIERGQNLSGTIQVHWQVKGAATDGADAADFGGTLPSGTVTFGPNEAQKTISFKPSADQQVEVDEGFYVEISTTSSGVEILQARADGTIYSDEASLELSQSQYSIIEGDNGEIILSATVQRRGFVLQEGSFQWKLTPTGDNPVATDDFIASQDGLGSNGGYPSGTVQMPIGTSTANIQIKISPDAIKELNETFKLEILNPSSGHLLGQQTTANGTISNDDATFALTGPSETQEGQTGQNQNITFTVTRTGDLSSADSVQWKVVFPNGGAAASDFHGATSGTLDFAANEGTKTIQLTSLADDVLESNEAFEVEIFNPSTGTTLQSNASKVQSTLKNDDIKVHLEALVSSVAEGNDYNGILRFKAVREGDLSKAATMGWSIAGQGAQGTSTNDFVQSTGNVTFAAGSSEAIIEVQVKADNEYDTDNNGQTENFTFSLNTPASGSGQTLGTVSSIQGSILNDDQLITFQTIDSAQEGNGNASNTVTYHLVRTGKVDQALTLNYVVDSSSTVSAAEFAGGQYPGGTVTFAAGQTTATIQIQSNGDTAAEGNESIVLKLTSPVNGVDFTTPTGTATVYDDDIAVSIAAQSATVAEGSTGQATNVPFKVSRTGDLSSAVTLKWTASGDTSTLVASSGTVTLAAGQGEVTLNLQANGNNTINAAKNMTVTLNTNDYTVTPAAGRTASGVAFTQSAASTQLTDDDVFFKFATSNPTSFNEGTVLSENNPVPRKVSVQVERSGNLEGSQTISWKIVPTGTNPVSANDFHIPNGGSNVNGFPSGTLTFTDGTPKNLEFEIMQDNTVELGENFQIVLESANPNVSVGSAYTGNITVDDSGFAIQALNAVQNEGTASNTDYTFKIIRIGDTSGTSTVSYTVEGDGNNPANTADFGGTFPSQNVTFNAGETEKTVTVQVHGDNQVEQNEGFKVVVKEGGITRDSASATINSDDINLSITAQNASVGEGNSGTQDATFTVTRTGLTDQATTVDWEVVALNTNTSDFASGQNARNLGNGMPSGSLSFNAGETSKTITVKVQGDSQFESNETFQVKLSNPGANTSLITSTANTSITNDDAEIYFDSLTQSVLEGDLGEGGNYKNITFTIKRSGHLDQTNTVNWNLGHITTNSSDFDTTTSGTVTFSANETTKTVTLKVYMDTGYSSVEGNETFKLNLSGASTGSSIRTGHEFATGTIIDDDTVLKVDKTAISQAEKRAGQGNTDYVWTLTREGYLGYSGNLAWTSSAYDPSGSSEDPAASNDLVGGFKSNQSISWNANDATSRTITISAIGEDVREDDEWFKVNLSGYTEFDRLVVENSTYHTTGTSATSNVDLYGEIKRDEAYFTHSGLYASKGSDTEAASSSLTETAFPKESNTGQTSSVWFQIYRSISTAGEAYADWKLTGIEAGSTSLIDGHSVLYVNRAVAADATDFVTADGLGSNGGLPSGRVTFADGEIYKWVEVKINGDLTAEGLEAYNITLSGSDGTATEGSGYSVGGAVGYILPDEAVFALSTKTITEGSDGGNQPVQITVRRDGNTTGAASVNWALTFQSNGTAAQDSLSDSTDWYKAEAADFAAGQAFSGTLNFADGESSKTIDLNVLNDTVGETWFEHFLVTLSNAQAGAGSGNIAISTKEGSLAYVILDDDKNDATNIPTFSVTANKSSEYEGTNSGNNVTYTITRSGNTNLNSQVAFEFSGMSSSLYSFSGDGANITTNSSRGLGVVNFTAGQTSKTVTVNYTPDKVVESDITTTFKLLDPAPYQQGSLNPSTFYNNHILGYTQIADIGPGRIDANHNTVTVIQKNDDIRLWVSGYSGTSPRLTSSEGDPFTFTITRAGRTDNAITINYTIANSGSPSTSNSDFTQMNGTITLAANQSSVNVSLDIFNKDSSIESSTERFTIQLSSSDQHVRFGDSSTSTNLPQNATFNAGILDDDNVYSITTTTSSIVEKDSGGTEAIKVKLVRQDSTTGYQGAVSVRYRLEGTGTNSASADDLTTGFTTGTFSLAANETEKEFTLNIVQGDLKVENNETFKLVLEAVTSGKGTIHSSAASNSQTFTIQNNDTGISIADAQITEGNTDKTITFTVTRSGDLSATSAMNWALSHGTTTASDFTGDIDGTLNFAANENTKQITLTVKADEIGESNETFTIQLSSFNNIDDPIRATATGTINNDDSTFAIQASEVSVNENGGNATFTVTRTHATVQNQTLNYAITGTGSNPANAQDFGGTLPTGTITFSGNELSRTITIPIQNDANAELDESFKITLTTGTGASGDSITRAEQTGVIVNDDSGIHVVLNPSTIEEGSDGSKDLTFQVVRSGSAAGTASVDWDLNFTGQTATSADFTGTQNGTVQFAAGEATKSVTLKLVADSIVESDETFQIVLSNAAGAPIIATNTDGVIKNDDANLSVAQNVQITEGNTGNTQATFTVTRSGSVDHAGTVGWRVLAGTATAADFVGGNLPSGTLNFASGSSTQDITFFLATDSVLEGNETFEVELFNASNGQTISQAKSTGTIVNDDAGYEIILPQSISEGTGSNTTLTATIKRTGNLNQTGTVKWALDASSTAVAADFVGATSGTANFAANQAEVQVQLTLAGDRDVESNEAVKLTLSDASTGHSITTATASSTITNDDSDITLQAVTASVHEGDSTGGQIVMKVSRTGSTATAETLNWTVLAGTANAQDFPNGTLPTGTVTLNAGEASKEFTITLNPDFTFETDETFKVQISGNSSGSDILVNEATATILADDDEISLSQNALSKDEGTSDNGFTSFRYTVTRSNGVGATSVNWSVAGQGDHAADASDFVATSGTVQFANGETSKEIEIAVKPDSVAEYNESFILSLNSPANGSTLKAGASSVTSTIVNDEPALILRALDASANEGNSFGSAMRFEITRTGNLSAATTASWNVTGSGTHAADRNDFGGFLPGGQINFAPGESSKIIYVGVRGDTIAETDETFKVELSNINGASVLEGSTQGTITNDDAGIQAIALTPSQLEGSGTNTAFQFKIEALGPVNSNITANWKIVGTGDHAAGTDDFIGGVLPSGSVTLNAGHTSETISINVIGDSQFGPNEAFRLVLENVQGAQLIQTDTTSTIQDDDSIIGFKTTQVEHLEGNSGSVSYSYDVERTGYLNHAATVHWKVVAVDGSGLEGSDFIGGNLPTGTLNFASGDGLETIQFQIQGDTLAEGHEKFKIELYDPSNGASLNPEKAEANGTVTNDDQALQIVAVDGTHKEGNDFSDPFTFDVFRSGKVDASMEVSWKIVAINGQSTPDANDFSTPMSGTFTWQANETSHRITLQAIGDTLAEADEHFAIEVSATGVQSSSANGVIQNDDQAAARLRWSEHTSGSHELVQNAEVSMATSEDLAGTDHDSGTYAIFLSMSETHHSHDDAFTSVDDDDPNHPGA